MAALTRRLTVLGQDTEEHFMETAIKVAFASTDMKHVDQHFGAAESFAIYALTPDNVQLVEATQFGKLAMDGNEDKLDAKIKVLEGCVAIYSQAVGASAVAKLKTANIQPVKVSAGAEISELLEALQAELRSGPSACTACPRPSSACAASRPCFPPPCGKPEVHPQLPARPPQRIPHAKRMPGAAGPRPASPWPARLFGRAAAWRSRLDLGADDGHGTLPKLSACQKPLRGGLSLVRAQPP